jgi:hypothetical protein
LVNADEQLTLNAKTEPKQLDTKDLALGGLGGEMLGIFRLEGDRLTWCQAGSGQERPSEFAPDKRTRTDVLVYRRLPAEKPAKLPPVEDLFASKSVWAGEVRWPVIKSAKVGMRIESRDGNKFKGFMMGFPPMTKGELSVSGEIAGNAVTLTWQARDASQSIACRRVGGLLVGDYPMDNVRTARLELEYGKSLF